MSSGHRKTANQLNAGRSTGPRTPQGRAKSSRNSRRHGLAVDVFNDPAWTSEVDRLTRIFTQDGTDLDLRQQARIRAGTTIDLMRVQAARMEVWNAALCRAAARAAQAEKHEFGGEFDRSGGSEVRPARDELEREAGVCLEILPQLQTLERYERRAHSWWKRTLAVLGSGHS